jgi:AcrR family transcriptional regulator
MTELPQPPARPRPVRPAGRPRTLDRDAVVDAALRVLDGEGLDAVTIRRVAAELGASGTALYTYVRDKHELVDLLVDRVIGEIDIAAIGRDQPWQEQVRLLGRAMRETFVRHRDIARATLGRIPQGPRALVVMNDVLGRLLEGGVPEQVISYGTDMLALYIGAVAYEESLWAAQGFEPGDQAAMDAFGEQMRSYFESLPLDRFPHLVALAGWLTADPDTTARFEFGLDVIIQGLAARAAA